MIKNRLKVCLEICPLDFFMKFSSFIQLFWSWRIFFQTFILQWFFVILWFLIIFRNFWYYWTIFLMAFYLLVNLLLQFNSLFLIFLFELFLNSLNFFKFVIISRKLLDGLFCSSFSLFNACRIFLDCLFFTLFKLVLKQLFLL